MCFGTNLWPFAPKKASLHLLQSNSLCGKVSYEAAFGEVVEDARLNVLLPQELLDKLDARVTAGGGNRSEVVRAALRAYL